MYKDNKLVMIGSKDAIYCGRNYNSEVNPIIGQHGWLGNPIKPNTYCKYCSSTHSIKGSTLECYRKYLKQQIQNNNTFKQAIKELNGKSLACFCKDKTKCHTNILKSFIIDLNADPMGVIL